MANKARYYGIITKEQRESKNLARKAQVINREELTRTTIYTAISNIPGIDEMSSPAAARKVRDYLMDNGFEGTITADGSKIQDHNGNLFVLTKTKEGMYIAQEKLVDIRRRR